MARLAQIAVFIFAIGSVIISKGIKKFVGPSSVPNLSIDEWWGDGDKPNNWEAYVANTSSVVNNRILYPNSTIDDLHNRLNRTFPSVSPLEGIKFQYGFNTHFIQEIVDYWRDDYLPRWRSREVYLWQFNHFTTEIQGLRVHFLHLMVYDEYKVNRHHYPVLLLHGWPSSIREFYSLIHKLHQTNKDKNNKYIFDVIVPSLPGYAWSQGTSKPGLGPAETAIIFRNLMLRLGYERFFIHAAGWSSIIGSNLATLFPENVLGFHSNMCIHFSPKSIIKGLLTKVLSKQFLPKSLENYFSVSEKADFLLNGLGSIHLQATKPDTIGNVLTDNPIGLAIYILDKFSTWTDRGNMHLDDGGIKKKFKLDALLDNIMIYYLTNSITTSHRLHAEAYSKRELYAALDSIPSKVPTGCAHFKKDIMHFMDSDLQSKYLNLIHSTYYKEGGHFPAMELPNTLYKDFIEFVKKAEKIKIK